jgi:hypothetical protein
MAERRMFSKRIINSARFLKMPISTQALYFHLGLNADDDGVVEAYPIIKSIGCTEDDLKVLVSKNFVVVLNEDLVSYITDWTENNRLRPDRKIDSIYKNLLVSICPDVKLVERKQRADVITKSLPMDNQWTTNGQPMDGVGKDSIGKDSKGKNNNIYADFEAEFDIVWKAYPRKEGKTNALKAYIKARTDKEPVSFETVQEGVKRYIEYIKANNTEQRYIKHGSTWFNQRCWNDDYTIADNSNRPEGYEIIKQEPNDDGGITYHYANGTVRVFDEYNMMIDEYKE